MNYSNKNILNLMILVNLSITQLFGALERSESWGMNFINHSNETINAHPYISALSSLALLSGAIYGANPKVRSAVNNSLSKTVNFINSKAASVYNKVTNISKKQITLGVGMGALAVVGSKLAVPLIKYYYRKDIYMNNMDKARMGLFNKPMLMNYFKSRGV